MGIRAYSGGGFHLDHEIEGGQVCAGCSKPVTLETGSFYKGKMVHYKCMVVKYICRICNENFITTPPSNNICCSCASKSVEKEESTKKKSKFEDKRDPYKCFLCDTFMDSSALNLCHQNNWSPMCVSCLGRLKDGNVTKSENASIIGGIGVGHSDDDLHGTYPNPILTSEIPPESITIGGVTYTRSIDKDPYQIVMGPDLVSKGERKVEFLKEELEEE